MRIDQSSTRAERNTLYLVCGMAGAGKTTLATALAQSENAVRLSPDEWIEPLLADKTDRVEMNRLRPVVGELQWSLTCRLLSLGISVIWEQGFWHREERVDFTAKAHALGAKVVLHLLDLPIEMLKSRIQSRNSDLPQGSFYVDPDEIDLWMTWFQRPDEAELLIYDRYVIHQPG